MGLAQTYPGTYPTAESRAADFHEQLTGWGLPLGVPVGVLLPTGPAEKALSQLDGCSRQALQGVEDLLQVAVGVCQIPALGGDSSNGS